uniref:Uncharacterized protein n=1 Tax=Timema poppense TaxID=170557 RepID=A0A7R9GT46_TIMPO|nr:unnamed protein product [Timema poppensis]
MINILQESCKLHEKEIKELQTKTNKLVKEREQIDEEHKKLKYEYDGQQAQLLGLQEVLLATKQQLQDMQGKGYEHDGETECNTHELERMREQLKNLNRDLDSLKFQICSKERDIKLLEEYKRKYIFLRKVETQHVALKRDYNHLSLEHKRLLNILRTGVKDNIDYLKEQLIRLDADNTTLRRDNERLIEELDNALENYQDIRNQESSLSALLLHSENGKESLHKELCSLSLQVSQHTEINNLNTDHVNKLEGIISELNIYIDTLKLEMNTASHKHEEERYLLKEQNDELTRVNVELMNELTKLRDQIKHHEVQISKSERRVDDAQKEVDQCKEVIKVLREKIELDNKRNNEVKELRARLTQAELNYQCYLDKTLKQQETLIESAKREVTLQQHLTDREKELLTQLRLAQEQEGKMTELVDMLNSELGSVKEEVQEKDTHLQLNITKLQTITTEREKLQKDYERSTLLNLKLQQGLSHANMSLVRTMESMEEKDSVLNSLQLQLSQLTEACQLQDDCEHDVTSEQLLSTQKKAQRLTAEVGRLTKLQEASNAEVRGFLESWWWDDFWQACCNLAMSFDTTIMNTGHAQALAHSQNYPHILALRRVNKITSLHEKIHKLRVGALSSNSQVKCAAQKLRQTLDENAMLRALIQQLNNENKYLGNEVQFLQATLHNSRQQDEGEEQLNTVFNLQKLNVQQERIIEQLTARLHYKNNSFKRLDTENRILVKRLKYFQQVNAMFSQALQNLQSRHELLIQPSHGHFSTSPKTSERSREVTRSSLSGSVQNMILPRGRLFLIFAILSVYPCHFLLSSGSIASDRKATVEIIPDRDSNLNLLVISNLVYRKSSALDHAPIEGDAQE